VVSLAVQRSLAVSDEGTVMGRYGAAATENLEVLSPELVLVDPSLREAWQRRPDEPSPEPDDEPARSVDDSVAAVRSLARIALDAEVRPRRRASRSACWPLSPRPVRSPRSDFWSLTPGSI
jgi:hypothetical protein